jgi:hypothetical protein
MKMAKVNPIQLQKHLKGVDYPASKEQLVQYAQKQGADEMPFQYYSNCQMRSMKAQLMSAKL